MGVKRVKVDGNVDAAKEFEANHQHLESLSSSGPLPQNYSRYSRPSRMIPYASHRIRTLINRKLDVVAQFLL